METTQSRCCTCGYSWETGKSGEHSCSQMLLGVIGERDFKIDQLERERDELRQALSGRTVSCEQCNEAAKQIAEKDAQIKNLCQDWADDDTRIKEIAKAHGIDVDSLSVDDGYFRTCVDVAEKMSEALTSKDAEIARLKQELREARDALAECDAYLMRYDSNAGGIRRTIKKALTASR